MLCTGDLSVSPLQGWFMASISMFTRCHRPGKKAHSLLLSKNECCNAALRYRQTRRRVTVSSRWDSRSTLPKAAISGSDENWTCSTCLQKSVGMLRKRAACWVTAITDEHQPKHGKAPSLLLTAKPPAPRHTHRSDTMNIWITDSYMQPDMGIGKAKSTEIHSRASYEAFWHVSKCVSEVAVYRPHSREHTYTESRAACGPSREQCTAHGCQDTVGLVILSVRLSRRCGEREIIQLAHTEGEVLTTLSWAFTINPTFKIAHGKHNDAVHRTVKPGNPETNQQLVTFLTSYPCHFFFFFSPRFLLLSSSLDFALSALWHRCSE